MISTPLRVFLQSKACEWLITRIRKEFTSKNTKEKISCGVGRIEEISHQSRMGWCEIRTCLMQLSSEGHIFLILAPNRTRFEALDS